jgi:NADP-dependent 3-hydroxy acid dehydrogenase YdfG
MPEQASKAVLITGCSSGIGRVTAERLVRSGWTVYATARRVETLAPLAQSGCRTLPLDVCDEASMAEAVSEVERAEGAVGVLVNNAGYGQTARSKPCRSTSCAASSRRTCSGMCAWLSSCFRACAGRAGAGS